jgi:hypothetical protein
MITRQLQKCPNSLIIIDEAQSIHASTLRVLQQFMEKQPDYVVKPDQDRVIKSRAIIGLILSLIILSIQD